MHFRHLSPGNFVSFAGGCFCSFTIQIITVKSFSLAGIYIHIPYCRQACHYCDFHFSTSLAGKEQMTDALIKEAVLQKDYLEGEEVSTIYFGGGTPSLLSGPELDKLLKALSDHYPIAPDPEITLEANPDDLSMEKLRELKTLGINRLSIGIQTFHDSQLRYMNRAHNAGQARQCMADARKAGFEKISIDLIYGIPSPGHQLWQQDLAAALEMKPEHISSYCLTIEPQTTFGHWLGKGKIPQPDEDYEAQQFELLLRTLKTAGYEHYEISNFCLPGMYSRHNSSYWQQQTYLGLGPAAHSFNRKSRQFNIRNNARYIRSIEKGQIPFEREELSPANLINEYLMTGLRTKWGCSLAYLKEHFNYEPEKEQLKLLNRLREEGYLHTENNYLKLTDAGKLLADEISAQLMVTTEEV